MNEVRNRSALAAGAGLGETIAALGYLEVRLLGARVLSIAAAGSPFARWLLDWLEPQSLTQWDLEEASRIEASDQAFTAVFVFLGSRGRGESDLSIDELSRVLAAEGLLVIWQPGSGSRGRTRALESRLRLAGFEIVEERQAAPSFIVANVKRRHQALGPEGARALRAVP